MPGFLPQCPPRSVRGGPFRPGPRSGAILFLGLLCLPGLSPAAPQANQSATLERLGTCRAISDQALRLSCYDRLARDVGNAQAAPEPTAPDTPATAPPPPETAFGLDAEALRREVLPQVPDALEAQIRTAGRTAHGKLLLDLDNGQRWRQVDGVRLYLRAGDRVRIRTAAAGSYLLEKSSGSRPVRVRREH